MEMLDDFEHTKMYDENLQPLAIMWKAQKAEAIKKHGVDPSQQIQQRRQMNAQPPVNPHSQNYFARNHHHRTLPDPVELASRLEEARTSAKLLEQVVMNTPTSEMLNNELIKEFADRCQSASRSIQGYMQSDNPAPDNETMESLIDTNEQLQTSLNQHQRAVLSARKALGLGERPEGVEAPPSDPNGQDRVLEWTRSQQELYATDSQQNSPDLSRRPVGNGKGKETEYDYDYGAPGGAGPSGSGRRGDVPEDNPFADPEPDHLRQPHGDLNAYMPPGQRGDRLAANRTDADSAISAGPGSTGQHRLRDDVSEEDLYDAGPPRQSEPVYRY